MKVETRDLKSLPCPSASIGLVLNSRWELCPSTCSHPLARGGVRTSSAPPSSAKLSLYQPPPPQTHQTRIWERQLLHSSPHRLCIFRQSYLPLWASDSFFLNGVYNPWLEGLEDQNDLREPGKVLKGTKCFASGVGYLGNILLF